MTDNNHPITPPPELVKQWATANGTVYKDLSVFCQNIANEAAHWGADQELEACINEIYRGVGLRVIDYSSNRELLCSDLRAARRPKPPSLKEQAKFAAAVLRSPDETCSIAELQQHWHTICNALEQLDV